MISDRFTFAYLKYQFEDSNEYKEVQLSAIKHKKVMWVNEKIDQKKKNKNTNKVLRTLFYQRKFSSFMCYFSYC
jgi:hypothetical protein